jgi:chromosome segregation ATPase
MAEDLTREELLRLYKSDIEGDVADRVEKRLIKRYSIAALVAVSVISVISGGFYAFASMLVERQVGRQVKEELKAQEDQIADLTREQRDRLADVANKRALAEVTLDVATNATAKANLKLGELEAARAELEQRVQGLKGKLVDFEKSVQEANDNFAKVRDAFNIQIEQQREQAISVKTELADASVQIAPLKESLVGLSQLSAQVQSLAETVQRLVSVSEGRSGVVEAGELSKVAERVGKIATQSAEAYQSAAPEAYGFFPVFRRCHS